MILQGSSALSTVEAAIAAHEGGDDVVVVRPGAQADEPGGPPMGRVLFRTSGTSGPPAPVTHSRESWEAMLDQARAWSGCASGDRYYSVLPLFHAAGLSNAVAHLQAGCDLRVLPDWKTLLDEDLTDATVLVAPTQARWMLAQGRADRLGMLRQLVLSAAPVRADDLERLAEAAPGLPVRQAYGTTEHGLVTFSDRATASDVGTPAHGVDGVRVVDGELQVRSSSTAPDLRDAEGWSRTGDLAEVSADGRVSLLGRVDWDRVNVGGETVLTRHIEDALRGLLPLEDVAVVPVPDRFYGDVPAAFLVPRAGREAEAAERVDLGVVDAAWPEGLARPRVYRFVSQIPTSPTGKVLKRELVT